MVNSIQKIQKIDGLFLIDLEVVEVIQANNKKLNIVIFTRSNNIIELDYTEDGKQKLEEDFNDLYTVLNKFRMEFNKNVLHLLG